MKSIISNISSFFNSFLKRKEEIYYVDSPKSEFENIREYQFSDDFIPDVKVIDFVPFRNKNGVEFLERETYPIIPINTKVEILRSVSNNITTNFITTEVEKIKRELDKTIFFELSEMGRRTASILSKTKDNMPMLALSHQTTKDSIIYKIKFADSLLRDMNGMGIKNITVSRSILSKIKDSIKDGILSIKDKQVQVYLLPEHLERDDELCLLVSSAQKNSENAGFILTKTPIEISSKNKKTETEIKITFRYGFQKCGTNSDFFYLRFFKT